MSTFSVTVVDGVHIVSLARADVLDTVYINAAERELVAYAKERPGYSLVMDLSNTRFLSSTALGMLIAVQKTVAAGGGTLSVCGASDDIVKAFKLVRLGKIVAVHDTIRDAADAALKRK